MSIQRVRRIEVIDPAVRGPAAAPTVSRQQRRFMDARLRKMAAIGMVTNQVAAMHRVVHEQLFEETRQGIVQLTGHDAWVQQMGTDAAQSHAIVKGNFYQTQMGLLQRLNQEVQTALEDLLDDVATLPDGFWYDRSFKDRLAAFLDQTYLELEDRALPRLTAGEHLRQFLVGDVVDRKVSRFDQEQATERHAGRSERRAIAAAQLLASLPPASEPSEALPMGTLDDDLNDGRDVLVMEDLRQPTGQLPTQEHPFLQEVRDGAAVK